MVVMVVLRSKGLQLLLRWPRHSLCREAKKMLTRSLLLSHGVREKDVASAQLRSSRIKTEGHLVPRMPRMPAFGKFLSMKHMKRSPKDISWCHGRMSFPGNTTPGCWFLTRKVSWVWKCSPRWAIWKTLLRKDVCLEIFFYLLWWHDSLIIFWDTTCACWHMFTLL